MRTATLLTTSQDFAHYCPVCTSCLRTTAASCPECGSPRPPDDWPRLDVSPFPFLGKVLDERYLLNQFLGDGATGYVYRAEAMQIRRHFAAKIVDTRRYGKPEFEQELLRRFRLEVEAMSRLRNPHVVAIYEAMQLRDNLFVLVMDFVDGRTLQELLDRVGRIKLERALDIVRQIANGLYEAHTLGFIHRDLKPDNIMIERLPASGFFARILDFGIVHMMDSVANTHGFRGTPLYASPEQCTGDPGINHRSDIYSLGCVFFHCITGRPPFPGTESLRVMDAHVNDAPPLVRDLLPDSRIPRRLDDLMQRMLAKDPAERPADLSEVIRDIDRLITQLNAAQLQEPTETEVTFSPELLREATDQDALSIEERRLETADFPAASLGEAKSSSATQIVRPLMEFHLPEAVAQEGGAFTATTLNERGQFAAVADRQHRVHVIGLRNDGYFETLTGARGLITALHLDMEHGAVYASEMDGSLLAWDLDNPDKGLERLATIPDRVYAITHDRTGRRILCGTERGAIFSLTSATRQLTQLAHAGASISTLAASPTENKVMAGAWGGALQLVELSTKKPQRLDPMPADPLSMVISADGYIAAVLDQKGHIRILSLVHGRGFFELDSGSAGLRAIAFADDSQLLGMGIEKTTIQLWDIRNQPAMRHLG